MATLHYVLTLDRASSTAEQRFGSMSISEESDVGLLARTMRHIQGTEFLDQSVVKLPGCQFITHYQGH